MSIVATSMVWRHFRRGGSEKVVLLALADWCNDDGGSLYPSMNAIAEKACISRSQAQRIVHRFIEAGLLVVVDNPDGGAPGRTRHYRLNLERLAETGSTDARSGTDATGCMGAEHGSHGCAETGSTDATQTTNITSINRQIREAGSRSMRSSPQKSGGRGPVTLQTFLDDCKAAGEPAIPESDPIFAYGEKVGVDTEMLACCWHTFKERYLATEKKQRDWRAYFRNAVRGNWYRLWYLKQGEPAAWTTAGEQARRAAA